MTKTEALRRAKRDVYLSYFGGWMVNMPRSDGWHMEFAANDYCHAQQEATRATVYEALRHMGYTDEEAAHQAYHKERKGRAEVRLNAALKELEA